MNKWKSDDMSLDVKDRSPAAGAVKPANQPALTQVQLTDLSLASEGTFSQRLNRVQKLSKNPSPAEIAELTVYLAAPENSICWLASATLSKIGGPQVEAAVKALLEKDISDDASNEARKVFDAVTNT